MSARLITDQDLGSVGGIVGGPGAGEIGDLRDRLRETSERLHEVELDNEAMRARLALRQAELEEARHVAASIRRSGGGNDAEMRGLLKAAEERAHAMALRIDRLEAELDRATTVIRLNELAEGLRDLDDELEIEEDGYLLDRPLVIRNVPTVSLPSEFK